MPLQIVHQDITMIGCDAVVNPSDSFFSGGGGTDKAIHTAAGSGLDIACAKLKPIEFGEVAVTDAYKMPCRYIIHTMGPIWQGGRFSEPVLLRSCYINALLMAKRLGVSSVAFPLISAGTFGFPKNRVLRIAIEAISDFLFTIDSEMMIYICILDRDSFVLGEDAALRECLSRITLKREATLPEHKCTCNTERREYGTGLTAPSAVPDKISLYDDTFAVMLLKLIDKKGMKDVECYKKANVSRNTFWKINNDPKYKPSKPTVIAFAVALELTLEETRSLLRSAGFALCGNNYFDVIIEFYIRNGIYDVFEINAALYQYDQLCLGC